MKIFSAEQIRSWDQYTIEHEPIASDELMERAAGKAFEEIIKECKHDPSFLVFCGIGNNGGDGLVIARLLFQAGKNVRVYLVGNADHGSVDFKKNLKKLPFSPHHILSKKDFPDFSSEIIIDALMGTGINRPVEGLLKDLIDHIIIAAQKIISIDIPSGLPADPVPGLSNFTCIRADITLTFQIPKLSFFDKVGIEAIGKLKVIDIHLSAAYEKETFSSCFFLDEKTAKAWYVPRKNQAEKRDYDSVLLMGGSSGMAGAIAFSAKASCLAGAGLSTILSPSCNRIILQILAPEAMLITSEDEQHLRFLPDVDRYKVLIAGPGLGITEDTVFFIEQLLMLKRPMLFDADALNIIASKKLQHHIPSGSIITPHQREFERLFGEATKTKSLLELQIEQSKALQIFIVRKGSYTCITTPDGRVFFNSTGNASLAKGGSGDVLSGIIGGFWARFKSAETAILLGVYLHGLSADVFIREEFIESLTPQKLLQFFPIAAKSLVD